MTPDETAHDADQRAHSRETLEKILALSERNAKEIEAARKDLLDVQELLSAWRNARGAIRTITILGALVRWLTLVGGSIAVIYYWIQTGGHPK